MNTTQKYELIRPILKGEKTPQQASGETGVPLSTIYYYLKQFQEGGGNTGIRRIHVTIYASGLTT